MEDAEDHIFYLEALSLISGSRQNPEVERLSLVF
jgi:hypothetical protein